MVLLELDVLGPAVLIAVLCVLAWMATSVMLSIVLWVLDPTRPRGEEKRKGEADGKRKQEEEADG